MQAEEPNKIIQDLAREIARGIELFCQCAFPSNYIVEAQLMCHSQNLVFQGRVVSSNDRESTDLVADIEKWIASDPTIIAKGEKLKTVKNDTTSTEKTPSIEPAKQVETSGEVSLIRSVGPRGTQTLLNCL